MQTAHAMRLTAPPALARGALRITPLGGVGEIGRNMTVFEYDGKLLVVDCGVLFPEETQPGIDVISPTSRRSGTAWRTSSRSC
jgi:ribonuclease J